MKISSTIKALLISYFACFIIQQTSDQFLGANLLGVFGLIPSAVVLKFWVWQLLTYSFLHADVVHLFLNGMMLLFIGSELENLWGRKVFLRFYFLSTLSGALTYLVFQIILGGIHIPLIGASGGIYGCLIAYGILFGERTFLFMMLFPMKAKVFIWVLVGIELMTTLFSRSPGSGVGSLAHLGGMGGGFMTLWITARMRQRAKEGKSKKQVAQHLKLIIDNARKSSADLAQAKKNRSGSDDGDNGNPKTWH